MSKEEVECERQKGRKDIYTHKDIRSPFLYYYTDLSLATQCSYISQGWLLSTSSVPINRPIPPYYHPPSITTILPSDTQMYCTPVTPPSERERERRERGEQSGEMKAGEGAHPTPPQCA